MCENKHVIVDDKNGLFREVCDDMINMVSLFGNTGNSINEGKYESPDTKGFMLICINHYSDFTSVHFVQKCQVDMRISKNFSGLDLAILDTNMISDGKPFGDKGHGELLNNCCKYGPREL